MMWDDVKKLWRRFANGGKCSECGRTDYMVQWMGGYCTCFVCRTCILKYDYGYYMKSLREGL